ncbi:MAG: DUF86 domain-containing protein [Terracidiphilus sp.]|nr:DUF86 domain-containing protein [Terracidiphilus sp.]
MSKHAFRAADYLLHMLEATNRALEYAKDSSEEQFFTNQMLQDAVIHNIEIVGEAANNLLQAAPEIAAHYPSIPFAQIYGMRNRISHGYFAVDVEMVWESVQIDLPELREQLTAVLKELHEEK